MIDVLVAVDLQNDFIDGALGTKEATAIVENAKKKSKPSLALFSLPVTPTPPPTWRQRKESTFLSPTA